MLPGAVAGAAPRVEVNAAGAESLAWETSHQACSALRQDSALRPAGSGAAATRLARTPGEHVFMKISK